MKDKTFDLLIDDERVRLTDNLCALEATAAISDINYLLDVLANYDNGIEINRVVYMLSCFSEMFLGVLTSDKTKRR